MPEEVQTEVQRSQPLHDEEDVPDEICRLTASTKAVPNKPYVYDTLPSTWAIRVLRLEPGQPDDPLKGSLDAVDLRDFTGCWALSYVWGDAARHGIVDLGGHAPITRSLDEALRRFRGSERITVLWVDAVCIDQSNIDERGHQVALMGRICNDAERVVAWLGPDPGNYADECFADLRNDTGQALEPREAQELSLLMRNCEWFSRLWVVQEITLARASVFVWGDKSISAEAIQTKARAYNREV